MNLVSYGKANVILHENPKKTYFKVMYKKHTNFGMQKFRIDFDGQRNLNYASESHYSFRIPRYGDLFHDTYIAVSLPNIWSSIVGNRSYNFQWVKNLGAAMIQNISINAGAAVLANYSGEYLHCMMQRDQNTAKKDLWNRMTGNIDELNHPAKHMKSRLHNSDYINNYVHGVNDAETLNHNVIDYYPHATEVNSIPSIRGRKLYIPVGAWFCDDCKYSIPLVSLQNQELSIEVTFRPVYELYTILNEQGERIAPDLNEPTDQILNFLNSPTLTTVEDGQVTTSTIANVNTWNSDVHLISTYIFLDENERDFFALHDQDFIYKTTYEHKYPNMVGNNTVDVKTNNLVSDFMWRFRRNDVRKRNEWFNYTNHPYLDQLPYEVHVSNNAAINGVSALRIYLPEYNEGEHEKQIMKNAALLMDGYFREEIFDSGIYQYIEKYNRTNGGGENGIYHYNFCLDSSKGNKQPSGAMNMNKYTKISFQFLTHLPNVASDSSNFVDVLCNEDGDIIATRKNNADLYEYNYDLTIFEERYNVIHVASGNVNLRYAR